MVLQFHLSDWINDPNSLLKDCGGGGWGSGGELNMSCLIFPESPFLDLLSPLKDQLIGPLSPY